VRAQGAVRQFRHMSHQVRSGAFRAPRLHERAPSAALQPRFIFATRLTLQQCSHTHSSCVCRAIPPRHDYCTLFYPISPYRVMILPAGKLWGLPFGETVTYQRARERFGLGCSWHAWRRVNCLRVSGKACR
jgi:hypothetical protein